MYDNHEPDFTPVDPQPAGLPVKWLQILLYVHIANIAVALISLLPVSDQWGVWLSRAVTLVITVSLFQLAPACKRYRTAAIFNAVSLGLILITSLLFSSSLLTLAASILSILATYQEYSAHSDMVAERDARLSRKWHSLFNWQFIVGILTSLVSMVAVVVLAVLEVNSTLITVLIIGALSLVSIVLQVIYLMYLRRMMALFSA